MDGESLLDGWQFTHQLDAALPPADVMDVGGARNSKGLDTVDPGQLDDKSSCLPEARVGVGVVTDDRQGVVEGELVVLGECPCNGLAI